ncbi:hypothetical protein EWM64_g7752 [Hericium alpestre]|uniref:Integrase catalytic domain-containing protein n=1 Tax=Hericium alpestre TaxID=135208 RepID=A0A4Y9ZPT1_9AGAM|nr:hypothetical protein EWM64_g7752 [Hericium alpestre]
MARLDGRDEYMIVCSMLWGDVESPSRGVSNAPSLKLSLANVSSITTSMHITVQLDNTTPSTAPKQPVPANVATAHRAFVEEIEDEEDVRFKCKRKYARGSGVTLPSREVPPHMSPYLVPFNIDTTPGIAVWAVDANDPKAHLYTRLMDPHNTDHVSEMLRRIQIRSDLTEDEHIQVVALLTEFADCFALSVSEVKPADDAMHKLNIPDGTTFSMKPHQHLLTLPQRQYLNKKVDEMLAAGIIEAVHPSLVKAVSPTTLEQKAHKGGGLTLDELQLRINEECTEAGLPPMFDLPQQPSSAEHTTAAEPLLKWRVCQNFNEVNKATMVAAMPQGDIHMKQQNLSGHRYLSVFDFASGFYALTMHEDSRPYSAFYVEGRGYFWYLRMPFGMTGVPASFAYVMGIHMHDLLTTQVMELFVDDGGAAADSFQEMMAKLQTIFTRVRERNLSLSVDKSSFFMSKAVFAVVDWPQPQHALNLISFLGLTGHFHDLVKDYARLEAPLRDLLCNIGIPPQASKSTYWRVMEGHTLAEHWTPLHTATFLCLKAALTAEPMLCGPHWDGTPFTVTSDGCKDGFAAVLTQKFQYQLPNGKAVCKSHPIVFASKCTSPSEEKYKLFLLEFAVLKFALDKFADIIWGLPVIVETDCQALHDILLSDGLNATHACWRDGILAYQIIDVKHLPGKLNVIADGLSRKGEGLPHEAGNGSNWTVNEDWEASRGLVNDVMTLAVEHNPKHQPLFEQFKAEPLFTEAMHHSSEYFLEAGKLWRLPGHATRGRPHVKCMSKAEAKELAYVQHITGGHWGHNSIKVALMDCVCSPGLDASIMAAIKECPQCKNYGALHLHVLFEPVTCHHPFELLVGDYLSMPKATGKFHTVGLFLDTFSQHIWAFKFTVSGSAKTTMSCLHNIFQNFISPETFMSDNGSHFKNAEVRTFCEKWKVKHHVVATYSPWVNGLVEGTNKLLIHVLAHLAVPGLGEDDYIAMTPEDLPKHWPDHLDEAVCILNNRLLPALKFTPKELLLGITVNTPLSTIAEAASVIRPGDADTHIAYVMQQHLDGYEAIIKHMLCLLETEQHEFKEALQVAAMQAEAERVEAEQAEAAGLVAEVPDADSGAVGVGGDGGIAMFEGGMME